MKGVEAVLAGSEPYTPRALDANPQLKVIARNGVGYDAVDVPAATARGVVVTVAPANQEAVAEHVFALMLTLAKQVVPQHLKMRQGGWPRQSTQPLRGRTLGEALFEAGLVDGREIAPATDRLLKAAGRGPADP